MPKKFKFKSKKSREKWRLFNYTENFLESNISGPHLELFGNREIIVEGCEGVFEYSDNYIKLNLGKGSLILCGMSFDIVTFENSTITVKGKINSLELCV